MREFCLTEEVIQQFVDGELSQEQTEGAAAHLAACEDCARLLDNVEQETAVLMQAFAPEMSLPVPTANLRERIDAAIAELEPRGGVATESSASRVRNWFGSLLGSFSFTPQQALGFASLAVVIAFAGIFAVIQLRQGNEKQPAIAGNQGVQPLAEKSPEQIADGKSPEQIADGAIKNAPAPSATPDSTRAMTRSATNNQPQRRSNAAGRPGRINDVPLPTGAGTTASAGPKLLPGEEGYLKAIASLTNAIEVNKDDVLKPTVRADYERNLAVVDQAIASTRQQAKRNPNDRDAVEFMYMAYQNKIELLSAVADQTRLASR